MKWNKQRVDILDIDTGHLEGNPEVLSCLSELGASFCGPQDLQSLRNPDTCLCFSHGCFLFIIVFFRCQLSLWVCTCGSVFMFEILIVDLKWAGRAPASSSALPSSVKSKNCPSKQPLFEVKQDTMMQLCLLLWGTLRRSKNKARGFPVEINHREMALQSSTVSLFGSHFPHA